MKPPEAIRHERAMKDGALDTIRNLSILDFNSKHFLRVLEAGSVALLPPYGKTP